LKHEHITYHIIENKTSIHTFSEDRQCLHVLTRFVHVGRRKIAAFLRAVGVDWELSAVGCSAGAGADADA